MWIFVVILALVLIFVVFFNTQKKEESNTKQFYSSTRSNLERSLKNINEDYNLGLSSEQLAMIIQADAPFAKMAQYVKPGLPTVGEFVQSCGVRMYELLASFGFSEEEIDEIGDVLVPDLLFVSENEIAQIAKSFSNQLPPFFSFLKGKINYTLGVLGMLEGYAQKNNHIRLHNKITEFRKKRDYL